jgi:CHAT domain-containing protein/tetratricopeptide (TPR) repeat protein
MPDIRLPGNSDLLSICALLRWFDHDLLSDLAVRVRDEIEALLASDLVETASEYPGTYRLRDDIRAEALARLRAENSSDELTWHMRFFDYFLRQMEEFGGNNRHAIAEDSVLYHLAELFLLIAARQEWSTFAEYITTIRANGPYRDRLERWFAFYDGFAALRTQNHNRSLAILTALHKQSNLENKLRVQVMNALGLLLWFQSHYDQALELYQQTYTLAQEIGDRFYQGVALANMSTIYYELGDYEQAWDLGMQNLQIFRALGDKYREAFTLYNMGKYAMTQGRWNIAQYHFHEAITLYEGLGAQARLAYLYWGQGFLAHMLGDESQSETSYRLADAIGQTPEYNQPELVLDIHFQLGFLYQTQGRWPEALSRYYRALELAHQLRNEYSATFIHFRRGNVFERQGRLEEAYDAYRAAIDGIEAMRGDIKAEEIKIGLLGTTQQVYESMILLLLKLDRQAEAFEYVERARSRAFLDLLTDKPALSGVEGSPELFEAIDQPVATLAEVQQRLPAGALLAEYFTIGVLARGESLINMLPPENTRLREHLTLPPQVLIFAVTRERLEIFRPEIDPNSLRPQSGDPGPGKRMLRDRLLARLHAQLIAPLAELLAARRLLYLIPHGPLHYVPFTALRSAEGAYLLAADGPAIALAPSATILLRNCLGRGQALDRHSTPLLALGYNDEEENPLRYAEPEARHVAAMLGGQAWTGPAGKSARLFGEARAARWLHIAGHAYYDPHDPLGSALKLGSEDMLSARQIIEQLELSAELVTLSACLSGVTQVVPGDEMLGLQRAFLYAGAPAVVCTLWETADLVALLVMDHFYADLRHGVAPAVALRDAQIAVRDMTGRKLLATIARWRYEDAEFAAAIAELPAIPPDALDTRIYADPAHWAAFMLIGRAD